MSKTQNQSSKDNDRYDHRSDVVAERIGRTERPEGPDRSEAGTANILERTVFSEKKQGGKSSEEECCEKVDLDRNGTSVDTRERAESDRNKLDVEKREKTGSDENKIRVEKREKIEPRMIRPEKGERPKNVRATDTTVAESKKGERRQRARVRTERTKNARETETVEVRAEGKAKTGDAAKAEDDAKTESGVGEAVKIRVNTGKNSRVKGTKSASQAAKEVRGQAAGKHERAEKLEGEKIAGLGRKKHEELGREKAEELGKEKTERRRRHKKKAKVLRRKHTMPAVLRILCSILLLAGMSVVFAWFLLWRQNMGDFGETLEFINEKPSLFAYSGLVIFMLMAVVAAATWRPCLTVGLTFALLSVVTYINMQKTELRNAPLLPEDLLLADQAGDIMQFVDIWSIVRLVAGIVLVLIGTSLLERCVRKVIGRETKRLAWWDRWALVPRAALTMAALAGLVSVTAPIVRRKEPEWLTEELAIQDWNQTATYKDNGFLIGFLYNMGALNAPEPDGYSEGAMKEIAQRYRAMKEADDERLELDEVVDNLIVILDETFYDPALLTKYYAQAGGDVTPNLHAIFRDYPSGYMYSPEYGGNTANVEFEVFTSLSNYWARTFPYVHAISKSNGVLAVPDWTKNFGFDTLAIHAYDGNMYKRNIVYPKIGFNDFIDEERMEFKEHEYFSSYINDRSVFQEILRALKDSSDPMMVGAVTMQNHMPYDSALYPSLDFPLYNVEHVMLENSFQSLHAADAYIGEFLEELDQLDEKTVVLWFGDHAAGLLDAYVDSEDKDDRDTAHLTPYFIYANFEIESEFTEAEVRELNAELGFEFPRRLRGIDLPVTTPNCLQNTLYDVLGVEKPSLLYLVDAVCESTPILAASYVAGEALEETQALKDYELTNYDVLGGKHYWDGE